MFDARGRFIGKKGPKHGGQSARIDSQNDMWHYPTDNIPDRIYDGGPQISELAKPPKDSQAALRDGKRDVASSSVAASARGDARRKEPVGHENRVGGQRNAKEEPSQQGRQQHQYPQIQSLDEVPDKWWRTVPNDFEGLQFFTEIGIGVKKGTCHRYPLMLEDQVSTLRRRS